MKKIEDYLHLYLGCVAIIEKSDYFMVHNWSYHNGDKIVIGGRLIEHLGNINMGHISIKPILRPLSDMSEEEMKECGCLTYDFSDEEDLMKWEWQDFKTLLSVEQFLWLLSKHFDLFGLIEAGLAIDKTKTKDDLQNDQDK